MNKFKSVVSVFLSVSIMLSGFRLSAQEEPSNDDIFAELMKSMGSVAEDQATQSQAPKTATDKAVADAFDGVDAVIEKSSVDLQEVTPQKVKEAKKALSDTPISGNIEAEFIKEGALLSTVIWGDAKDLFGKEITNIIKRLYQTNDAMNFRIIVNSDPIPWISAKTVDLNESIRKAELARFERDQRFNERQDKKLPTNIVRPSAPVIPERMGSTIEISAGLFATVKNTDELAARLAYELAKINPKVYGVEEDSRFVNRAEIIALINQLVEKSDTEDAKKVRKTRDEIIAEFSAIERLAAAGFNPWGLYNYEKDTFGFLADKFLKSPNHFLGRRLSGSSKYKLDDWSRPIRLLLQSNYMSYLQGVERGGGMVLKDTELPKPLKKLKNRLRLYTVPFYSGTALQSGVILGTGLAVTHYYFPELAHWALSALQVTGSITDSAPAVQAVQEAAKSVSTEPGAMEKVGDYVVKMKGYSSELMDSASATLSQAKDAVTMDAAVDFVNRYTTALGVATATMTGVLLAKKSKFIGEMMHSISRSKELDKIERERRRQEQVTSIAAQSEGRDDQDPKSRRDLFQDGEVALAAIEPIQNKETPNSVSDSKADGVGLYQRGMNWMSGTSDSLRYGFDFIVKTPARIKVSSQKKIRQYVINGREFSRRSQIAYQRWAEQREAAAEAKKERDEANRKLKEEQAEANRKLKEEQAIADKETKKNQAIANAKKREEQILTSLNERIEKRKAKEKYEKERAAQRIVDKEKNRLARIEAAKKRKEFYHKLGQDSLAAWETFDRVMTALPGKTEDALVMGLKFGKARGNTFLFEYLPAKGQGAVDAAHAVSERVKEFKRDQDEKSEQRRQATARLQQAVYKRESVSRDDTLAPDQIEVIMRNLHQAFEEKNDGYLFSEWGINLHKFNSQKKGQLYFNMLERWIYQANLYGADDLAFTKMAKLIEVMLQKIPDFKYNDQHRTVGVRFLRLMMAKGGEESQRFIKAISVRSDLIPYGGTVHTTNQIYRDTVGERSSYDQFEYYNDFLSMMNSYRLIADKGASQEPAGKAAVEALRSARSGETKVIAREFYKKDEKEVIAWLGRPETSEGEIRKFLLAMADEFNSARWKYPYSHLSLGNALKEIHPLGAIRFLEAAKPKAGQKDMFDTKLTTFNAQMNSFQNSRLDAAVKGWLDRAQDMSELAAIVEEDTKKYGVNKDLFKSRFYQELKSRPDLIKSLADYKIFYEKDYFWFPTTGNENVLPLERPLQALLDAKRKQAENSVIWLFDPILTEQIQSVSLRKLIDIGQYPKSYSEIVDLWSRMTSRGVSTVTDDMLSGLLKTGNPEQIDQLEKLAVNDGGRVFDQVSRDELTLRQIKRLPSYIYLMNSLAASKEERVHSLNRFLWESQSLTRDMGIRYTDFLEELSVAMNSTFEEAKIIDDAKTARITGAAQGASQNASGDSRIAMFEKMLDHVKNWKPKRQVEFLLYLRGNIQATDFIKAQFPKFGPERIRKIYQGLPMEAAMLVARLYLGVTVLAYKDVNQGHGKKLVDYIVSESAADKEMQEYASLLLQGLLKGLKYAGNPQFKTEVVSALVAMKPDQIKGAAVELNKPESKVSIGETIKVILEKFPGAGPKIGQFLVGTNRLPEDINKVLSKTQDQSLPPSRYKMFTDIAQIVGKGTDIGIELGQLLGAGSLKYSALGRFNGRPVALQIFREDVQNNVDHQIKALHGMIDDLIEKGGKDWAFLRVIVDGAVNAVHREKDFTQEAHKTKIARETLYAHFSDDTFNVKVPNQTQLNKRLLVSDYAAGISFKDDNFPEADKLPVAIKLLEMEAKILYGQSSGTITYDTDRHAGNYLIDIKTENGRKKYNISPIDFGQLTTITVEQRERVERIFSYAALLGKFGQNDWLIEQIANEFGLKGKNRERLAKSVMETFPLKNASGGAEAKDGSDGKIITDYFSLISAINESFRDIKKGDFYADVDLNSLDPDLRKGKLDFAYTDFVRAIIQLNQYEDVVSIPKHVKTPSKILSERVKDKVAKHLEKMELSRWQGLWVFKTNAERWIKSKVSGEKFEEFNFRLTRAQLDAFDVIGGKGAKGPPADSYLKATSQRRLIVCGQFYQATTTRK